MQQHRVLINSIHFSSAPNVKQIAAPLIQTAKLHYFGYCQIYPKNLYINFATNSDWPIDHYLSNKLPPAGLVAYDSITSGLHLPTLESQSPYGWPAGTIHMIKEKYGIINPVLIFKKNDSHLEVILFSFTQENSFEIIQSNHDFFNNFIFLFKEKAASLISLAQKQPLHYQPTSEKLTPCNLPALNARQIPNKKYLFLHQNTTLQISPSEYNTMRYLSKGYSYIEIAEMTNASVRTVEGKIQKLKNLFDADKKIDLINIFNSNVFL